MLYTQAQRDTLCHQWYECNMNEKEPLLRSYQGNQIVYTRRWWILLTFSFSCFMQTLIWNTWGPIAQSAKEVFKWNDATIGMIPSLGNISCIFTVFLASYVMDEKGMF